MVRTLLLLGALGGVALGVAAPASADSADFIKYLTAHDVDVPTPELRSDFINLGQAICDHLDAAQDPNRTVDYLVSIGHTNANANMWLEGSVLYLCPRLNYLTHYPTNPGQKRLLRLYQQGEPVSELATLSGISRSTLFRTLKILKQQDRACG